MKNELQTKETNNLQTTTFEFHGDELIAIKDESTGEIYTSINEVLRGIGFANEQVRYQRSKWIKDKSISKGVLKFNIPTNGGSQLSECISTRKLPIALAKINITKRLLKDYPNITERLEIYQDKCADVLASVFIDKQQPDINSAATNNTLAEILHTLKSLVVEVDSIKSNIANNQNNNILVDNTSSKKPEPINCKVWFESLQPKYNLLKVKYYANSHRRIYSIIYNVMKVDYSVDFDILQEEYCNKHNVEKCYIQEAIFDNYKIRKLYEETINKLLIG